MVGALSAQLMVVVMEGVGESERLKIRMDGDAKTFLLGDFVTSN